MGYTFTKYTTVGAKSKNYSISLNVKSYSFGFLSSFYRKENIKDYKKVVLFYDLASKAVAFKFTKNLKEKGAFAIIHGSATGSVAARSFIMANNLDKLDKKEYGGKKTPKKIKDSDFGELFVIDLQPNSK